MTLNDRGLSYTINCGHGLLSRSLRGGSGQPATSLLFLRARGSKAYSRILRWGLTGDRTGRLRKRLGLCPSLQLHRRRWGETGVERAAERGGWRGESHPQEGSHRRGCTVLETVDSIGRPTQAVLSRRGEVRRTRQ